MRRHYREIGAWIRAVSARAYTLARSGAVPVFLGGDHSLSMGSVNGVARHWHEQGREVFVLWLDAHADYNTPATTISGHMHGMVAGFLCGEPGLDRLLGDEPRASIKPSQLDLFGTRSIDPLEKDLVRERKVAVADMRQIDEFGVGVLIRRVIERVKARDGVLHVSFDVDFLDPDLAPGVGTIVPGGATYREAHLVMELLHDSGLVRAVDIVELNPFLDERGRTARVATELVGSLFGQQITDRPTPTNAIVMGKAGLVSRATVLSFPGARALVRANAESRCNQEPLDSGSAPSKSAVADLDMILLNSGKPKFSEARPE